MGSSLDKWLYNFARRKVVEHIVLKGTSATPETTAVTVLLRDGSNNVLLASGTTVPVDNEGGYAKGALFIDTDVAAGTTGLYENVGDTNNCNFDAISSASPASIALSNGKVLIGGATNLAAEQTVSGDFTITNAGVASLAGTASSNVSANTSRATSNSVIESTNLSTLNSKDVSQSTLISTAQSAAALADDKAGVADSKAGVADSKALSVSVLTSTADSKAVSNSVVISTNLSLANSKDASQSLLISNHESRMTSHSI